MSKKYEGHLLAPAPLRPPAGAGPPGPHQGEEGGGARHSGPQEVQETPAQHHGPVRHQVQVSRFLLIFWRVCTLTRQFSLGYYDI